MDRKCMPGNMKREGEFKFQVLSNHFKWLVYSSCLGIPYPIQWLTVIKIEIIRNHTEDKSYIPGFVFPSVQDLNGTVGQRNNIPILGLDLNLTDCLVGEIDITPLKRKDIHKPETAGIHCKHEHLNILPASGFPVTVSIPRLTNVGYYLHHHSPMIWWLQFSCLEYCYWVSGKYIPRWRLSYNLSISG